MNKMKKRRWFWKPVALGFAVLYLVTMTATTVLIKEKFVNDYKSVFEQELSSVSREIQDKDLRETENKEYTEEFQQGYYEMLLSEHIPMSGKPFMTISGAIYDKNGEIIARTANLLGRNMVTAGHWSQYVYYGLEDLSEQHLEELANYRLKNLYGDPAFPEKYRVLARLTEDRSEPGGIVVQEVTWNLSENSVIFIDPLTESGYSWNIDGNNFREIGSRIVWEWTSPDVSAEELEQSRLEEVQVIIPYCLSGGKEKWQEWSDSAYLHDFEEQLYIEEDDNGESYFLKYFEFTQDSYPFSGQERLVIPVQSDRILDGAYYSTDILCYLELRMECHPWLAAMDYMKYIYLAGLVLVVICAGKIIYVTNQTYRKQELMEETRKDFTNAMAHELKTPLGIIRGFAENLQERTMEEKRDYYVEQIIRQTEEMDHLVAEMITVSRLDSEQLALRKEPVSFAEIFREQLERFSPVIEEKRIRIQWHCEKDFLVEGDRGYLEKAVWNILSNAVVYNVPDGSIRIITEKNGCTVENTGFSMTEEELSRAFEIFYSGDESRSTVEKHMGMGLFLTRKILELHGLKICLENTEEGVRTMIQRG